MNKNNKVENDISFVFWPACAVTKLGKKFEKEWMKVLNLPIKKSVLFSGTSENKYAET